MNTSAKITKTHSLTRNLNYLYHRWISQDEFLISSVPSLALKFKVSTRDVIGRHIFKYQAHEVDLSNWILQHITPENDDLFLDIGANIGWYSLLFSHLCQIHSCSIFAFEPDPFNCNLLHTNLSLNNIESVNVIPAAISSSSGRTKLYTYNQNNRGRHSLIPSDSGQCIEVDCISLDDLTAQNKWYDKNIKLMKLDIEGFEYQALVGAQSMLQRCNTIIAEYSPTIMRSHQQNPEDLLDLMKSYSFKPTILNETQCVNISEETLLLMNGVTNIIWQKA